jgi:hypothetical protein
VENGQGKAYGAQGDTIDWIQSGSNLDPTMIGRSGFLLFNLDFVLILHEQQAYSSNTCTPYGGHVFSEACKGRCPLDPQLHLHGVCCVQS